ncbi:hypothetical protein L2750_00300 [Shewanella submarina]|uniref:Uncharacterized protein n=1 Tax=Shewanella submarina TaxID=2016376 RepID=A0ABV7GJR3_9GAMM|nr:hypothetical protein [Shewanella submarina]MCL1035598.1 hypothetical protein [Shewanella submarina]
MLQTTWRGQHKQWEFSGTCWPGKSKHTPISSFRSEGFNEKMAMFADSETHQADSKKAGLIPAFVGHDTQLKRA